MASYTIVSTAVQEDALTAVLVDVNASIDAQNVILAAETPPGTPLPHIDKPTYITNNLVGMLTNIGLTHQQAIAATCIEAFAQASSDNQLQVLTMLGLASYAVLPAEQLLQVLELIGLANFLALSAEQQNEAFALVGLSA